MHDLQSGSTRHFAAACTLLLALSCAPTSLVAEPGTLLLQNVRPVDAVAGEQALQDVFIDEGRIVAMGKGLDVPASATRVDGAGRTVIPGLWDMHVHLSYDPRFTPVMSALFLDYGITSVRDTGGLLEEMLPIVENLRSAPTPAPRIFFAGPLLDGIPVVYDGVSASHIGISNATPEIARQNVARLASAGVDLVKIYEMVSPGVFDAMVTAARDAGLPIAAHVPLTMLASRAGPAVDSMEHLRNLELDCARSADTLLLERRAMLAGKTQDGMALRTSIHKEQRGPAMSDEDGTRCTQVLDSLRDTIQVPTARLNAMTQHPPFLHPKWQRALSQLPDTIAADWARAPELISSGDNYRLSGAWTLRMIPRLHDAGVPIGAGTDTPIGWAIPGFSLHRELEILVAAGLTPQEALNSATVVPASFFGLEHEMGQVSEGYLADLVILDSNPLLDIRGTQRIHTVIAKGRVVREPPSAGGE